jgi:two-component system, OmpR family, phosphate regulon sensor histidine kinase PhoR
MLTSQLFWRVFAVYAALALGTGTAFVVILSAQHKADVFSQLKHGLQQDAETIRQLLRVPVSSGTSPLSASSTTPPLSDVSPTAASGSPREPLPATSQEPSTERTMASDPPWMLPAAIQQLNLITQGWQTRVLLLDPESKAVWSNTVDREIFPDVASLQAAAWNSSVDRLLEMHVPGRSRGQRWLLYREALEEPAHEFGQVWLARPLDDVTRTLWAANSRFWAAGLTIVVLSLATTYVVVGRIIGPLESLTDAARRLTAGESPTEVNVSSRNELGTLAAAFNSMSRQLSARIEDLNEQRQEVENHKERLETVLGAMVEGVMAIDAQQRVLLANNAALRMLDLRLPSLVGRPLWEVVRHAPLHDVVEAALAGKALPRQALQLPRTQSMVTIAASPLVGDPSSGVVLVMHDETELYRLENLRREFVQNVSHELKTPLSSISAYAETLLDGGLDDEDARTLFVRRISEQADRLSLLIVDLLALARIEAAETTPQDLEPVDVAKVVESSVDAHQAVAHTKHMRLMCTISLRPLVHADEAGLRTILDNLLDNALNYTPEGGTVSVRLDREGSQVRLDVVDTGVGIAKEHQARIFERFFRIDKARSRERGGTGLGLAIVKHLCQMFSASVRVSSQLGQGSTFTVCFPELKEQPSEVVAAGQPSTGVR